VIVKINSYLDVAHAAVSVCKKYNMLELLINFFPIKTVKNIFLWDIVSLNKKIYSDYWSKINELGETSI